jgi:citrate lyase subunit beta/citryl-CoA lyase
VAVLDGVFNDVKDADGFLAEARQGREMGFDGKTLIHPGQVEPANGVFAPSPEQVEEARAVVDAFEQAQAEGRGVATLNGRLIENLHVDTAHKVLATADAIAALDD